MFRLITDLVMTLEAGGLQRTIAQIEAALAASGSPTPEADLRAAIAWADRRAEDERAELEPEEDAPAWLAPLVEGADPLPDPRPIPVVEEEEEYLGTPAERWRDPWHSLSGERATTQRAQTEALEGWTDARWPEVAADHAETHDKLRARIRQTAEDLRILERIREGIGRTAPWPAVALEQIRALLARTRPVPTQAVRRTAEDLRIQIEAAPAIAAQADLRALIAADRAPEAPAAPDPGPAAPADPRTRAAYLRALAEESDREAARRRAEADALDPQPAAPVPPAPLLGVAAELAAAVSTLRAETGAGPIPEGELPEAIRTALADRDATIGQLKRDLQRAEALAEERAQARDRLDAETAAAWTALGGPRPAGLAATIRTLLVDRAQSIGSRDREIEGLRAELAASPPALVPAWRDDGDGGLVYSAPPPPILARVEPDADGAPVWYWRAGDRRGTAGSPTDAQAICDLFLGRAP